MNFKSINQTFTDSQERALERLDKWWNDPDDMIHTLSGRAGTGKTYLAKYFIDKCVKVPMCVTAPTHKAVRVIEKATNRKGHTLQSLHGLRPNVNLDDFDINNLKFDAIAEPKLPNYKFLLIDECGMINKGLATLNYNRARDLGIKILYMGDPCQLPPVNETISPTFADPRWDKTELTDIVRQDAGNPLIDLLETIVKDIATNGSEFLRFLKDKPININSKGEGYQIVTTQQFEQLAIENFKSKAFSENPDSIRIAAWKNDTVLFHNTFVRNTLYKFNGGELINGRTPIIDTDDLLVGYKSIYDEFLAPTIINSEDYFIDKVIYRESDERFNVFSIDIISRVNPLDVSRVNIVDHNHENFIPIYYNKIRDLYLKAIYAKGVERGKNWRKYFEFKDKYLTLLTFPIKNGDKILATVNKELDYGFSLTTHKLQGSTISTVFVDLKDFLYYKSGYLIKDSVNNPNAIQIRNKLAYTAISRASKFVYILI